MNGEAIALIHREPEEDIFIHDRRARRIRKGKGEYKPPLEYGLVEDLADLEAALAHRDLSEIRYFVGKIKRVVRV